MFVPCLHRLHCYMAVWSALHSSRCDRGQWVLWARLTSCCCNPADTPAGRQTDGPTDKPKKQTGRIYSLSAYASSQQAARPDTPWRQTHPEYVFLCLLCGIHKSVLYKYRYLSGSLTENAGAASGTEVLWSLQVNHSLFPTFWKGVHVGMFISHG